MTNEAPTKWYGVRPAFWIAGGIALLGFGVISGVAFDIATQPVPKPSEHVFRASPKEVSRKPLVTLPTDTTGSILQRAAPEEHVEHPAIPEPEPQPQPVAKPETPLASYAVPVKVARERPVIAIVLDDMGLDRTRALKAIDLPGPLTVSFMTYADGLSTLVPQAREHGHEVLAHLPMEPIDAKENPGPGALTTKMDDAAIQKTLAADLDSWKGYVGINNHMGSKFTRDKARMAVVMTELKARGLLWLDSKTIAGSAGLDAAKAANVPFLERDEFLDNVDTLDEVVKQLANTLATAKSKGTAIAIGHPHDATLTALKQWLPTLEAQGVSLVPVTEILKRRQPAARE